MPGQLEPMHVDDTVGSVSVELIDDVSDSTVSTRALTVTGQMDESVLQVVSMEASWQRGSCFG